IWRAHVAEMTALAPPARHRLMGAVWAVEQALRDTLAPAKVNLAELGNQVPHLHWHIIPRWRCDTHFPGEIWGARVARSPALETEWLQVQADLQTRMPAYHAALRRALDAAR
ncbi:MAG: HIT family protein, partial [Candidimonas sp.]